MSETINPNNKVAHTITHITQTQKKRATYSNWYLQKSSSDKRQSSKRHAGDHSLYRTATSQHYY